MKSSVIVHGSENFLGSRLVKALENQDWASVQSVRSADVDALRTYLPGAQFVAHCIVDAARDIKQSAASLYGLLSAMAAAPRVVHLSSMTVYGSTSGTVDESCALLANLGPYSAAQRQAEELAAAYPRAVILRSGVEYGPTCVHWSGRVALWLRARRLGDLGMAGDGVCNLVYIDDLISAMIRALREPAIDGEIFNVASADKPTWNDYFSAFALALGAVPVRRIGTSRLRFETRVAAPVLRLAELATGAARLQRFRIPPPIPPSLLRICRQEIDLSVARIELALGTRWTPLQEGLRSTAEYYR